MSMDRNHDQVRIANTPDPKGYALSGKIMLTAIVVLFFVVVLMVGLHLYARWYLLRQRRRQLLRRRRQRRSRLNGTRRAHIVFYVDSNNPNTLVTGADYPANRGLAPALLGSLPVFVYRTKTHPDGLDCAVCLSEFEEDEKGRVLPRCNHAFHTECIDMWFFSHSTCPICRAAVEPINEPQNTNGFNLVVEPGGSSSVLCAACQHEEDAGGSSSTEPLGSRRKGLDLTGVRIEVPSRGTEFNDELPLSSPASYGFRSPGNPLLSLKRILSMGRKTPTGSSTAAGTSCSPARSTEVDLESGNPQAAESTRIPTPRGGG